MANAKKTSPATTSAHTPGPWLDNQFWVGTKDGIQIADCVTEQNDGKLTSDEKRANCRLISAAPALRTASQMLYDALQCYLIDVPDCDLPADLVDGMNELEAAWHQADGTSPEHHAHAA